MSHFIVEIDHVARPVLSVSIYHIHTCVLQMMVAMKRAKWDGSTTGSRLAASVAKVHDELKVTERLLPRAVETSLPLGGEGAPTTSMPLAHVRRKRTSRDGGGGGR